MRPISLNHSHRNVKMGKRLVRVKTKEAVMFETEFAAHLSQLSELKNHIHESYTATKHSIEMECYFYLNDKSYFTLPKKGERTISKKSMDIDNMIKVGNDQIFKWLEIDDSQVTKLTAEKIPTNAQDTMVFRISLVRYPDTFVVSPSES